jgi:hypothetical protein
MTRSTFDVEFLKCDARQEEMEGSERSTMEETRVENELTAFTSAKI